MKKTLLILISMALIAGCTDEVGAQKALHGAGYTNIQTKGYAFTGCSDDDSYHTEFSANGPSGQHVDGVVCGGVFKGSTIRTY